jgi:hypothetical protein
MIQSGQHERHYGHHGHRRPVILVAVVHSAIDRRQKPTTEQAIRA